MFLMMVFLFVRLNGQRKEHTNIVKQHVSYVPPKYGNCCIVFDGYKQGPSIKEQERRVRKACADIQQTESSKLT